MRYVNVRIPVAATNGTGASADISQVGDKWLHISAEPGDGDLTFQFSPDGTTWATHSVAAGITGSGDGIELAPPYVLLRTILANYSTGEIGAVNVRGFDANSAD